MGCLHEIRTLRELYSRHRAAGFEIVGIAFVEGDEDGKAWLRRYLDEHGMSWPQVPTASQWYSAPFEAYDVNQIPFNLLLDPEGRIIAADLRGKALERQVEAALRP